MMTSILEEKTRFKGVVFDLDGLLIDSEPIWAWAQQITLAEFGANLTPEIQKKTRGLGLEGAMLHWTQCFPKAKLDKNQIRLRLNELALHKISRSVVAKPGVHQTLEIFKLAQYKIGLASSSTLPFIKAALIKIGIADTFHELVSGESEPYGKPHPSIYLKTAKLLGLPPENCIAFEDSINGLRAAKAAGMYCIAIPEAVENLDPGFEAADHIFASLNEFRLSYLMV